jgi:hypothetical protein
MTLLKRELAVVINSLIFFSIYVVPAHILEDRGKEVNLFVIALIPNLAYLLLALIFKPLRKRLKATLLVGNLLMVFATFIGFMIWLNTWD